MTTPEQFLSEFCKEIVNGDPMQRQAVVKEYAQRLESMLQYAEQSGYDKVTSQSREDEERQEAYSDTTS